MVPGRVYTIDLTAGVPRRGWCDRCQTSAELVIDVYHLTDAGMSLVSTLRACPRCDPALVRDWEAG